VDHRGIRRVLEWHHLSPDVLKHRRQQAQQAPFPALSPDPQLEPPFEPTTLAQRLALDSLGYRHGHMTVWAMVALYKQVPLTPPRAKRPLNSNERPKQATIPHQVWFADIRYLVKIDGRWLYSVLIFDGYSRAIIGAGCFDRQNFAQLVQVFRQAIAQWGAPEAVVSAHRAVFVALQPCLAQLAIRWAPITKGHPWQNPAEGGFSVQRRMLDAYVTGCADRETVYRQHAQFVHVLRV